jgi:chromosomal replication initiation ATPase DnaA
MILTETEITEILKEPINVFNLKKAMDKEIEKSIKISILTARKIIETCLLYFSVSFSELSGRCRRKELVIARYVIWYIFDLNNQNLEYRERIPSGKMGAYFNRDHSTVINSFKVCKNMIETNNKDYVKPINELMSILGLTK